MPSPPPPPPPPSQLIKTEFTAAGDVGDYDAAKKEKIAEAFAAEAGVSVAAVDVTVVAASVKIFVEIAMPDDATAVAAVLSTLQTKLADAAAATAFLADADVTVVEINSVPEFFAPPPPPPSPWWGATGCPITRSYCMNDAGLPDNCNCGDCGFPACGDCDCDYYGESCCTGGHGGPATSSWPNQHECREYSGDYGDCCANEAMGDPAACAYGYCPTHQPQSYDGCEDGGNYGCNPGDCWGVETVYASAESYSESEDAIVGLLLTAPINGGMCQPECRDFVPQALGSQCHGLALDWLPRTFD